MNTRTILILLVADTILFSCAPQSPARPAPKKVAPANELTQSASSTNRISNKWGSFREPINVQFMNNGREIKLLNNAYYTSPNKKTWIAPESSVVNGASIPRVFWSIIGGPLEGSYRDASVFHDVACQKQNAPWDEAARMFYTAMRCNGVGETKAKTMFAAVYHFGPKWEYPKSYFKEILSLDFLTETTSPDSSPAPGPTEENAKSLKQWIESKNPSLDAIEAMVEIPSHPRN